MCVQGFRGKGYSRAFAAGMADVVGRLRDGRDTLVRVLLLPDDICAPCPHLGQDACVKRPNAEVRVQRHDRRVTERLGIEHGQVLPWSELKERIRQRVAPEDLDSICKGCPWLPIGYCHEGLRDLREPSDTPRNYLHGGPLELQVVDPPPTPDTGDEDEEIGV